MKFIKLLAAAYVNGLLRMPHEGVLHLKKEDADRLLEEKLGEDVSSDFSVKDGKIVPVEGVTTENHAAEAALASEPHEHQASIAPAPEVPAPATEEVLENATKK